MVGEKLKNKLAEQRSYKPITYYIEPKVSSIISVYDINFDINAEQITESILTFKSKFPESNSSNVKAWHSYYKIHHQVSDFDNLIKIVENRVLDNLSNNYARSVECLESWAIIYKKGDKTIRHKHSDQQYSAVYYAKAEKNPSPIIFDDHLSIIPKTGMLICFPGWVYHSVPEITSEQERICMSFNINCLMTTPNL